MTTSLRRKSKTEEHLVRVMRERAVEHIRQVGEDEAAEVLQSTRTGVRKLLRSHDWDLATAYRILEAFEAIEPERVEDALTSS